MTQINKKVSNTSHQQAGVNPGDVQDLKEDVQLFHNGIVPNMFCYDIKSLLGIYQNYGFIHFNALWVTLNYNFNVTCQK